MDNMKLQCQVYHNGALVVNNVHKLTKNENISNISTVFNFVDKLSDDLEKEFYSHENVVKMRILLTKFKQCYDNVYSVSRPLCRHLHMLFKSGVLVPSQLSSCFNFTKILPKFYLPYTRESSFKKHSWNGGIILIGEHPYRS